VRLLAGGRKMDLQPRHVRRLMRRVPLLLALGAVTIAACHGRAEFPSAHRETAAACPADPKFSAEDSAPRAATADSDDAQSCGEDKDCTKGRHGRCVHARFSHCGYDACMSDAECPSGRACACATDGNRCVPANCRSDADCGGRGCSPSEARTCNSHEGIVGYYCHTPKDSCTDSNDCGGATSDCEYSPEEGRWTCVDHGRCVG